MVHRSPAVGLVPTLLLGLALTTVAGLGPAGAVVGLACVCALFVLVTVGLSRSGRTRLGPADRVTLARAVLTCGVAAVVAAGVAAGVAEGVAAGAAAGAATGGPDARLLVGLASASLVLDAVDGRVARRTRTMSPFGARFDMESDAVLILVLSVHVAGDLGWWVLAIGAARYVLVAAQWCLPWLRRGVPARRWRKAVAAYQGIALTAAASGLLPGPVAAAVVLLGLLALVVSFGTEAAALRRLRRSAGAGGEDPELPVVHHVPGVSWLPIVPEAPMVPEVPEVSAAQVRPVPGRP